MTDRGTYADLTFRAFAETNGVARLDTSMVPSAGGAATDPDFIFLGGDADGTDWTTASFPGTPVACTRQAVAVQPTYNDGSPCLSATDDSVLFNESDYYLAPNTTFGQVTTEDFIVEAVFNSGALDAQKVMLATRVGGVGYALYTTAANKLTLAIEDVGGAIDPDTAALDEHTWYHAICFLDRSGSAQFYINGVSSGAATAINAKNGTLDGSTALTLGSRSAGGVPYDSAVAYLAMWKGAAWLTSHLNPDTAAERFGKLAGYWPQVANGTSAPNTSTRAFAAYSEKIESSKTRLYQVGGEWLRYAQRVDANGETVNGYLAEPAATNDLDNGNTFAGWALEDVGDSANDNNDTGPDNDTSMAAFVCDATDGNHGISDATANNLSAANHCGSIVVGTGNATWVKLVNTTVANAHCWFDIANGTVGTKGAGFDEANFVGGEMLGAGTNNRRIYGRFTGTVAAHTLMVRPVDGDADENFSGGNGADITLHLFGAVVEQGDYPTSIIDTNGAAATRLKDQLQFKGDDGSLGGVGSEGRGTIELDVLIPDYDSTSLKHPIYITDGGAAADRIYISAHTSDGATGILRATAGDNGDLIGSADIYDGERHRIRMTYATDDARLIVDGVLEAQDVAVDVPDNLDEIDVGQSNGSGSQLNGLICDLKIWSRNKVR